MYLSVLSLAEFFYCMSISGFLAVWAFVLAHSAGLRLTRSLLPPQSGVNSILNCVTDLHISVLPPLQCMWTKVRVSLAHVHKEQRKTGSPCGGRRPWTAPSVPRTSDAFCVTGAGEAPRGHRPRFFVLR